MQSKERGRYTAKEFSTSPLLTIHFYSSIYLWTLVGFILCVVSGATAAAWAWGGEAKQ